MPVNSRKILFDTRQRNWKQNPYISLLAESIAPDSTAVGFTWLYALFGKYDVVHVHWPEYLLKHRSKLGSIVVKVLFATWLLRLRLFRIPVMKTMHNRKPHDTYGRTHTQLLYWLETQYSLKLWLMPSVDQASDQDALADVVIPHGDYKPWLDAMGVDKEAIQKINMRNSQRKTVHFLCFGVLKRYKNIHESVSAIAESKNPDVRLSVKGTAPDAPYLSYLHKLAADDDRILIVPERLNDDDLVKEILAADIVIIPYPDLYNSGVLLLALSLGRPVALRNSRVAASFQREFGSAWIHMYKGEFTAKTVECLVPQLALPVGARYLSRERDWERVGARHNDAYSLLNRS